MKTLLERAASLIARLDQHEGTEGWSAGMSSEIDQWQAEYRNAERARIRTLPAVAWHAIEPREIEISWVEVLIYQYRWSTATVEGWGNATVYYDTEARVFYRKLQNGHPGYGQLQWNKGEYQQ